MQKWKNGRVVEKRRIETNRSALSKRFKKTYNYDEALFTMINGIIFAAIDGVVLIITQLLLVVNIMLLLETRMAVFICINEMKMLLFESRNALTVIVLYLTQ